MFPVASVNLTDTNNRLHNLLPDIFTVLRVHSKASKIRGPFHFWERSQSDDTSFSSNASRTGLFHSLD